jgi:hypothetical protein
MDQLGKILYEQAPCVNHSIWKKDRLGIGCAKGGELEERYVTGIFYANGPNPQNDTQKKRPNDTQ